MHGLRQDVPPGVGAPRCRGRDAGGSANADMKIRDRVKEIREVPAEDLLPHPENWRTHPDGQRNAMKGILAEVGNVDLLKVVETPDGLMLVDGHLRADELRGNSVRVAVLDLDEDEVRRILFAFDRITEMAERDRDKERALAQSVEYKNQYLLQILEQARAHCAGGEGSGETPGERAERERAQGAAVRTLAERFIVPPLSVLDCRQGYWQIRKRAWIELGIASEEGRVNLGGKLRTGIGSVMNKMGGRLKRDINNTNGIISIFDPVLAELAYRWFSPPGGVVLDPFAGGSVRGVVASLTGRQYVGIDLSQGQIDANRAQWEGILESGVLDRAPEASAPAAEDYMPDLTPIEEHGGFLVKRDDLFRVAGVRGGKVRSCWHLAQGAEGLVTAGSRSSPQVNIVGPTSRSGSACPAASTSPLVSCRLRWRLRSAPAPRSSSTSPATTR